MKTLKTRFKYLPIVLAVFMLLQGCTVYKNATVTMQEAASKPVKTKVKTVNGQLFFKYITFENDNYYGVKKSKGDIEKIRLDEEFVETLHLKNKPISAIISIVMPLGIFIGLFSIAWTM